MAAQSGNFRGRQVTRLTATSAPDADQATTQDPAGAPSIVIDGVTWRLRTIGREPFVIVDDLSVTVQPGGFSCLVGPSGCGKTTTLNLVAGFVAPTTGVIRFP